jgi:drug/metabolite transporter (DMT)-like permease
MAVRPIQGAHAPDENSRISNSTLRSASDHAGFFRVAPVIFLLLWSSGFATAKVGLAHSGPLTFLTLRYALVLAALVPALCIVRPPLPRRRAWADVALVGLLVQFGYFVLNFAALAVGAGVSVTALVSSLQPVLVALLAPLAGVGPRVGGRAWIGLALGLAGTSVVIVSSAGIAAPTPLGVLLAVLSVLCMAAGTICEKQGAGRAPHPLMAATVQYAVGLLGTAIAAALFETMRVDWTPGFVGALLYLVVANSLIAISLLFAMVRRGDAARVSTLFFLVPPTAALIAWLVTGEPVAPAAWAGMAVAALGVLLVTRRS